MLSDLQQLDCSGRKDGLLLHVASVAAATRRLGRAPPSTLLGLSALLPGGAVREAFRPLRAPSRRFGLARTRPNSKFAAC